MAVSRYVYIIGNFADTFNAAAIAIERLFPFNHIELQIFFNQQAALDFANAKKKPAHENLDIPIFKLVIEPKQFDSLQQPDKVKIECVKEKIIYHNMIRPQQILLVHAIYVARKKGTDAEFFPDKFIYKLGLIRDTQPYQDLWNTTPGPLPNKMLALLNQYTGASLWGLFRHYKESANKLKHMIEKNNPLHLIQTAISQELSDATNNYAILDGDYGATLRILLFNLQKEEPTITHDVTIVANNNVIVRASSPQP